MRGERAQPRERLAGAIGSATAASSVKLMTQPSVTFGSKRKPWAIAAGTRIAAGAANGSRAASNVISPPPRSIRRI
jgi:hypothetical protein